MKIETAYDAYWFLHNHPKNVIEDPEHPLVDFSKYAMEGIGRNKFGNREGLPHDAEYERGRLERADAFVWEGNFIDNLWITYVKVNPETQAIDDDKSKNTQVEVWLETGPAGWISEINQYSGNFHDPDLDVGGPTFDDALIALAKRVQEKYGEYKYSTSEGVADK